MKKIILSLCVFSVVLIFSNCTNNSNKVATVNSKTVAIDSLAAIKIPDTNFKAYLVENFDKNNDGEISLLEALAIEYIDCSNKDIASLEGMEKFANLTSLDCRNNKIEYIDLCDNKKINKVACEDNKESLSLNVGFSTPIMNPNARKPASGGAPQDLSVAFNTVDTRKCTFDDGTAIIVHFND